MRNGGRTTAAICFAFVGLTFLCGLANRHHAKLQNDARRQGDRQKTFLFIGALSGRNYFQRRNACRVAWAGTSQDPAMVTTRFFMAANGTVDPEGEAEIQEYSNRDLVLVPGEFSYYNIGLLVLAMFEHALEHYDVSFILKTDDDSFVNVPALLIYLRQTCEQPDCSGERSYMGIEGGAEVRYGSDHKFRHEDFWQQTGLAVYPPFMRGGGYIVSADAARALLDVVKLAQTDIFTTPVEDAAIGFYMACLKLRRFNSSRWWAVDAIKHHGMAPTFPRDKHSRKIICSKDDTPFVIHNQKSPEQMLELSEIFKTCSNSTTN